MMVGGAGVLYNFCGRVFKLGHVHVVFSKTWRRKEQG